jgi:predicted SAM-dependent methyltransferase
MPLRINVGCGRTPTQGWKNFDNSWSLRISKLPRLAYLLNKVGFLTHSQYEFVRFARENNIAFGNATTRIPVEANCVEVIYSSHMLEHLDRNDADNFLKEVYRVLRPGGIIRLAVPDIHRQVSRYIELGDADGFMEGTHLCQPRPRSIAQRLRLMVIGNRNHHWMYDGNSLAALLKRHGFVRPEVVPAGETRIAGHEPLDLRERCSESVYVEAQKALTS